MSTQPILPPTEESSRALDIYRQFRGLIVSGQLGAGERLPTVRQTASDLGVAPGTAAKAYKLLERDGLVVTRCYRRAPRRLASETDHTRPVSGPGLSLRDRVSTADRVFTHQGATASVWLGLPPTRATTGPVQRRSHADLSAGVASPSAHYCQGSLICCVPHV